MTLSSGILACYSNYTAAKKMAVCLTFICFVPLAGASDLLSLWGLAQETDSKYLGAKYKYLANQEGATQARSQLLPNLSFQAEYKKTDQTVNESDNTVFGDSADYPTKTYGLTLTQSVFDYARWQRFYQSKASVDRAEVEFKLSLQQLMLRLSESYFLVLEREDQLKTVQDEKAAMSKHLSFAEKKLKSGLGRRVDAEDAQARYLNALSKEVELQSRLMDSRYALREVIGVMPQMLAPLRDDVALEVPAPQNPLEWVSFSRKHNLEIQAKEFALREMKREVSALRSGHYPTLDLMATSKNIDTDGSIYGGGSDIDTTEISLQLNVPIYSGGGVSSKVRQSLDKQNVATEELNDQLRIVERSSHDAYYRIGAAIVQIGALAQSVKAQERMLQSKSSGYSSGRNSILEVLDAQQNLSHARQALTKAKYDYVLNVLRLKFTAGDLTESDLESVNGWLVGAVMPVKETGVQESLPVTASQLQYLETQTKPTDVTPVKAASQSVSEEVGKTAENKKNTTVTDDVLPAKVDAIEPEPEPELEPESSN